MKNYILFSSILMLLVSCQFNRPEEKKKEPETEIGILQGVAKEVLQTSNYTYVLLNSDGKDTWIAGPGTDAKVGEKYYVKQNMVMQNFQSKELGKFFESIIFVELISSDPGVFKAQSQKKTDYKAEVEITKKDVKIAPVKGITSVADLFLNKSKLAGTTITVKGVVTKYNPGIMGKNWIHIQDGTENDGHFDLVVTTSGTTNLGDTITLSGKLVLDKDFGYGYKYDVLLEDAVVK